MDRKQLEQTGATGSEPTWTTTPFRGLLTMVLTAVVCLGAGWGAAYFVIRTNWHPVAKIFVGANGVFFALVGMAALTRTLQQTGSPSKATPSSPP